MMKLRLAAPDKLVDIGKLKDLDYIREAADGIHIGAGSTHHAVEISGLVRGKCPLLAETVAHVGDPLVRNMGTIGGSVAHADPSADYPAALQALEAKIVLKGSKSETQRFRPRISLSTRSRPRLSRAKIVREVIVPVEDSGVGTSYQKMVQPASGFAIVGDRGARLEKRRENCDGAHRRDGIVEPVVSRDSSRTGARRKGRIGRTIFENAAALVVRKAWTPIRSARLGRIPQAFGSGVCRRAHPGRAREVGLKISGTHALAAAPDRAYALLLDPAVLDANRFRDVSGSNALATTNIE